VILSEDRHLVARVLARATSMSCSVGAAVEEVGTDTDVTRHCDAPLILELKLRIASAVSASSVTGLCACTFLSLIDCTTDGYTSALSRSRCSDCFSSTIYIMHTTCIIRSVSRATAVLHAYCIALAAAHLQGTVSHAGMLSANTIKTTLVYATLTGAAVLSD
jgi:hypothetical protein